MIFRLDEEIQIEAANYEIIQAFYALDNKILKA